MKNRTRRPLIPPRLLAGDTIGVVAPASPFDIEQYYLGVNRLERAGYKVLTQKDIFLKNGYLAGTDAQRADMMMRLFADASVKAVFCARGGFGSMRILPLLDYDLIRQYPKVFVGFSDVTALLAALYAKCRLVGFHGPVVASLPSSDRASMNALVAAVSGAEPVGLTATRGEVIAPGSGSGPVLAGNLTTLCHLIGTAYMPKTTGHVLLFEDRGEAPYRLDRMLTQLKLAGYLDDITGLAFGSLNDCGKPAELARVIRDHFSDSRFPVLTGIEVGHGRRNLTLPIGLAATLDADQRKLTYHGAATRQ